MSKRHDFESPILDVEGFGPPLLALMRKGTKTRTVWRSPNKSKKRRPKKIAQPKRLCLMCELSVALVRRGAQ